PALHFASRVAEQVFQPLSTVPDHPALEREILAWWDEHGTFDRLREQNRGGPTFSFMDGPITANNPAGVHHGHGRTLKDVFQRYKAMQGFDERYQNGFDSQGLWVEVEVEKELGLGSKREIEEYGLAKFARKCVERVAYYSEVMTEQCRRLGQWMDWDNDYYTFSDTNIEYIWGFLKTVQERGWLYKGHRSTQWCPRCGTSLSQHEQAGEENYKELEHPSLYVRFPLKGREGEALTVWTTTPWTLPANVAAAVHPHAAYGLPGYGPFEGLSTDEAAEPIVAALRERGLLAEAGTIVHRYPICWRCKTPLVFRVVDDWFIGCDELRQPLLDANNEIEWTPPQYKKGMDDWLRNMGDWNISRKRYFGLPLPFYPCHCGHLNVIGSLAELKERATSGLEQLQELHRPWIDEVPI